MVSDEEVSEDEMAKGVLTGALRYPKRGISEQLVCQHLFQATFSHDNSVAISHMTRAALLCAEMTKKQNPDGFNVELLEGILQVNSSLLDVSTTKIDRAGSRLFWIPWGFPENKDNYEKNVKPWKRGIEPTYYPNYIKKHLAPRVQLYHSAGIYQQCDYVFMTVEHEGVEKARELIRLKHKVCPKCGKTIGKSSWDGMIETKDVVTIKPEPEWSWFFEVTSCLAEAGYERLKNAFQTWAISYLEKERVKICEHVNPQTYAQVMSLFMKKEEEKA